MNSFSLAVSAFFDGEKILGPQRVDINNGLVSYFESIPESEVSHKGLLTAGFIDWQVNGGGGVLFNEKPTLDSLIAISQAHVRFGSTGIFPTLITDEYSKMELAASAVAAARRGNINNILGVHFEGPHLSLEKKGVHSERFIRPISQREIDLFCREELGRVIVTLAPEQVDVDIIEQLTEKNVIVSLGHSNASYSGVVGALAAGASGFTHLFNAMSPLTSREPGMVGAALTNLKSYYGLIMDGIHVHPAVAKLALNANPNMTLVTDAMSVVGTDEQSFELLGETITRTGSQLTDPRGRLAGSALDMANAVINAQNMLMIDKTQALNLASKNVAHFLSMEKTLGTLSPGKKASMVLLEANGNVIASWVEGVLAYQRKN
ncbi:N-acetylglucosamine-6-phosphate deacetylase [Aliikangiella sp. G2MR2-5]|uniref:N-acetylglucosamine-6-phosphate deacetylase n=1 Tax=Aliikangiella sp. G2MR2-5 TaxID=2788943 RepID=UPI0018A91528|nr:N-acetylglucosamine-6-phosphate deacetylase [Aliikangiella sp. G2MR2-5]